VEIERLLPALIETLVPDTGGGAMCHYPIHGLRVWKEENMLFESSFCWACGNYSFDYDDVVSKWMGLSPGLEQMMKELMPIPEAEIRRFEKKDSMRKARRSKVAPK
jgi:hypothetical protein